MGVLTILTVVAVFLVAQAQGQGLNVRQLPPSARRPRPPAPTPPVKPAVPRNAAPPPPSTTGPGAPKQAPAAKRTPKPAAAKAKGAAQPKNDRYLQSLGKITSFMVKLNSFLELTIGTITKQLTDLTTQMAEVRGSLDNLVTSTTQTAKPIIAKPPPVPDLPAVATPPPKPAPKPALPPTPVAPAPPPPAPRPAVRRPVQQRMQPRMQPMQRFVPAPYQQLKPAVKQMSAVSTITKPPVLMQAPQRRMEYYPRQKDPHLRWPGNHDFHPWWQNWWNKNFQGFYPEKHTPPRPQTGQQQFGSTGQQFGSRGQNFGSSPSTFGSSGSHFSVGTSPQFNVGTSPQFNVGTSPQFGSGSSSQFGGGMSQFGGSQFGGFGSMNGGMGGGGEMWQMRSKSREPGETEGKGA